MSNLVSLKDKMLEYMEYPSKGRSHRMQLLRIYNYIFEIENGNITSNPLPNTLNVGDMAIINNDELLNKDNKKW